MGAHVGFKCELVSLSIDFPAENESSRARAAHPNRY
jgi:hypothetical protein